MRMPRSFISLLTILIMLPWGAYARNVPIQSQNEQQDVHALELMSNQAFDAAVQLRKNTKVSVKKKCRIAILPGSPCGPDRALPATTKSVFESSVSRHPIPIKNWYIRGRHSGPPRDPPRFF